MGTVFPEIDEKLSDWIGRQRLFFVGTAPGGSEGHINVSPKGDMTTFAIIGPRRVAYVDFVGSGIETVAHLKDNGRIVVMLCAFEGPPKILRLHGEGRVVEQREDEFGELFGHFELRDEALASIRSIISIEVTRISDSCGFCVPQMKFERDRKQLFKWAETHIAKEGPDVVRDYADVNNGESIDGLPGLGRFRDSEIPDELREKHDATGRKL